MNLPGNLNLCSSYSAEDVERIRKGIVDFNLEEGPLMKYPPYGPHHLILKDSEGNVAGGMLTKIYLQCLYIEILWIDRNYRKSGVGSWLMEKIEEIAREQGCSMIHLDTFSFQAIDFYKKFGYQVFGEISDYPEGIKRYFLKKKI